MSQIDISQESSDDNDVVIVESKKTDKRSASPIITGSFKRQKTTNETNTVPDNEDQSVEFDDDDDDLDEQIIEDSDVEIIEKPDSATNKDNWVQTQHGDDENEVVCIICYGEVEYATVTKCGHVYCLQCLHEYVNKGYKECAVCRQGLTSSLNRLMKMKYKLVPIDK